MEQICKRASLLFEKKQDQHELYSFKPELLAILNELKQYETDDRTFQILNTLAIDHKSLIVADLDILKSFTMYISEFLKKNKKPLPELGRKWALRVLRWILVMDPDAADVEELKQCFLMAVPTDKFYLTQLEMAIEQLTEKISFYISVQDEKLLTLSLEGFAEYFKLDPVRMESKIVDATETILTELIRKNLLQILPDEFISNLIVESSSAYYNKLSISHKTNLCKCFVDVFEFEILRLLEVEIRSNWILIWLSEDLTEFRKFCAVLKSTEEVGLRIFLERIREEIIEMGRLRGFHSFSKYENCFKK